MDIIGAIRKNDGLKVFLIVLSFLIVATGVTITLRQPVPVAQPEPEIQLAQPQSTALSAILYGVWQGTETIVHGVNADGTGDRELGRIPLAVKNIHRLDDERLLFIANTNDHDHGTSIEIRNMTDASAVHVVSADAGWGIDSVIVSPDGRWIAYWEVQLGSQGTLTGGYSRVYTASLSTLPAQRNRLFDESAHESAPVHYPLFFDHRGNLYSDSFSPNKDGWGQGLVRTGVTSASPNEFEHLLSDEEYNSIPVLSSTTHSIAFTAYVAANGQPMTSADGISGKSTVETLNPNTVIIMDLDTGTQTIHSTETDRLYYDLTWKDDGNQLFARSYGSDGTRLNDAQAITYDINAGIALLWDTSKIVDGIILGFGPDGLITGVSHASGAVGNLGKTYAPVLSGIAVGDGTHLTSIPAANAQFITSIARTFPLADVDTAYQAGSKSPQLATFQLKPEIHNRPLQQNELPHLDITQRVRCRDIYNQLVGRPAVEISTSDSIPPLDPSMADLQTSTGQDPSLQISKFGPQIDTTSIAFNLPSFSEARPLLREMYNCYDSPLYLYPKHPTRVQVTVTNADILETDMPYTAQAGWNLMADPKGTKISYAYGAPFTPPENGIIVKSADLESTLTDYGGKIGLNPRELSDYVSFWTKEVRVSQSPYYRISHFPDPSAIMHFVIIPSPDVMIQTVMYFKPLTEEQAVHYADLAPPAFSPVPKRHGFTAVDWSGIIDR